MPVTGWLVILSPEVTRQTAARAALTGDTRVALGEAEGVHLPLVATLDSPGDVEEFLRSTLSIDGIVHCDLVFADLEQQPIGDADSGGSMGARARRQRD